MSKYLFYVVFFTFTALIAKPADELPYLNESVEFFEPSQVKPGLRGEGYTVFSSVDGMERFGVHILGTMKDFFAPGYDLILAHLEHPELSKSGMVVAGMSGSPVYIEGKLLGAVGYGFGQHTLKPVAGIMPIGQMMNVWTAPPLALSPPSSDVYPVAIPLVSSGISQSVLDFFAPHFKKLGFAHPTRGGGSAFTGLTPQKLTAGGPIAVSYMQGAQTMSGIGTVTWVKDDRFLAFGHPFHGTGKTDLPASYANIVTTVFSTAYSYKLGQATQTLGVMSEDRLPAIGGYIGRKPKMTAVTVDFDEKSLDYEVAADPAISPLFIGLALGSAIDSQIGFNEGGTFLTEVSITFSSKERLQFSRQVAGFAEKLGPALAAILLEDFGVLLTQEFEDIWVEKVRFKVSKRAKPEVGRLVQMKHPHSIRAGEQLVLPIDYDAWQKPRQQFSLKNNVPKLAKGNYELIVADARESSLLMVKSNLWAGISSHTNVISNFKMLPKPGELCVFAKKLGGSARVSGEPLGSIPLSYKSLLKNVEVTHSEYYQNDLLRIGCHKMPVNVAGSITGKIEVKS